MKALTAGYTGFFVDWFFSYTYSLLDTRKLQMYLTSLLWVIFSLVFAIVLHRKSKGQFVEKVDVDSTDYRIQDEKDVSALPA